MSPLLNPQVGSEVQPIDLSLAVHCDRPNPSYDQAEALQYKTGPECKRM